MSQPVVILINKSLFAGVAAALLVSGVAQAEDADTVEERIAPIGRVRVEGQAVAPVAATPAPVVTEAPTAEPAAPAAAADGQTVYQTACFACHGTGAAGAPKLDDPANWAPRIAQGESTLVEHAIKGFNAMPPKGGNMSLADADVEAAVVYMLSQTQ